MLKPQRLLARRPLDQLPKQRLRALKPRDRARIGPWRAGLLAAHRPPITIHASQRWFAHRAVSLPGAIEQVEQIWSHAITSVSRSERDITSRLRRRLPALLPKPLGVTREKALTHAQHAEDPGLSTHYKRPAPIRLPLEKAPSPNWTRFREPTLSIDRGRYLHVRRRLAPLVCPPDLGCNGSP